MTGKTRRSWNALHGGVAKAIAKNNPVRGGYDEILGYGESRNSWRERVFAVTGRQIIEIFRPALEAEYVDFDRKKRGSALNHDLYAYDPSQGVAVIQARQAIGSKWGMSSRKTYFLVGMNEITHEYFRHPVGAHAVRAAVKKRGEDGAAVIADIQKWMWEVTDRQLKNSVRQGDVLLVPEPEPKKAERKGSRFVVGESHEISADEIRLNGRVYALNPTLIHTKGQHRPAAMRGWCSIRIAREADAWDFAERIGD